MGMGMASREKQVHFSKNKILTTLMTCPLLLSYHIYSHGTLGAACCREQAVKLDKAKG